MGLDTTHDAWHGPYGAFKAWREKVAKFGGFPPLGLMKGFCSYPICLRGLPISWDINPDRRLVPLLNHSDSDGVLNVEELRQIVPALKEQLPKFKNGSGEEREYFYAQTEQFIKGAELAIEKNEPIEFG